MTELGTESKLSPLTLFVLTFLVAGLGFVVIGPLIGVFLSLPFIEGDMVEQLQTMLTNPLGKPQFKVPLYIMQGSATLFGLGILPSLFWYSVQRKGITSWFEGKRIYGLMLGVILLMILAFMVTNSLFIDWNANLAFPDFMKGFENWAREYEDRATVFTKYLTQFSSPGEFVLAFVVIAVLPAFGEELVFRGMLQPLLFRSIKNIHLAIWTSAILFSAFHLQFFGFVPRMLLGALFGYLYYWSGNLFMPMFAHFVNNGLSVIGVYLNQLGLVEMDVESTEAAPWPALILFSLMAGGLLYYYKQFFDQKGEHLNGR